MKPLTPEWIDKAESDYRVAMRELGVRDDPSYDAVCFHAQQCAEKYLKACLQEHVIPFERSHNLVYLLDLLLPVEPQWEHLHEALQQLTEFAVEIRYPGTGAELHHARWAMEMRGAAPYTRTSEVS